MQSFCGRYVVVFNGEIYNYESLRQSIEAKFSFNAWRGTSDTEVLATAIAHWGVEATLPKLNGMFAFAVFDRKARTLTLARDRFGEKPLYYGWSAGSLLFASELKAIRAVPGFAASIEPDAVAGFLRYCYVPTPLSIYQGIFKLEPGKFVIFDAETSPGVIPAPTEYWSASRIAIAATENRLELSDSEAIDIIEQNILRAVELRMHADVPLGAFLSGGIDSSAVVAAMQVRSSRPVKTFCIGFSEGGFDESQYAKQVANHLGTEHTEYIATPADALAVVPDLPSMYDEPFADVSQIPTYLVSRLARRSVSVSLSGDGGDELFGGYNRHSWGPHVWSRMRLVPRPIRALLSNGLQSVSTGQWDRLFSRIASNSRSSGPTLPGLKIHKLARILGARSEIELYDRLVSFWDSRVAMPANFSKSRFNESTEREHSLSFAEDMMIRDTITYLPDDILVKVDRASMAVSLEARVPLLDPDVFELAWRLPANCRIRGGVGKWALREFVYRHVPRTLIDRPKAGFAVPIADWLRGPLRSWADDFLSYRSLSSSGLLDPEAVGSVWKAHLQGGSGNEYHLWSVLMLQAWLDARA